LLNVVSFNKALGAVTRSVKVLLTDPQIENLLCFPKEANFRIGGLEKTQGVDDSWQAGLKRIRSR
jgi:hypothetical protein